MMIKKSKYIKDMKAGDVISETFVVKFKKPVEKYKNGYKFELRVGDSSKEIMYKYWGQNDEKLVQSIYDNISNDDVIAVTGKVNEWNNNLEIANNNNAEIKVLAKGEYDVTDFIKATEKDIEAMWKELSVHIENINNPDIKKFLEKLFSDEVFLKDFKHSPAAMYNHHGWIGGLLEHTLNVANICASTLKVHTELDADLLIAGAIIHDIGKMEEYETKTSIKISEKGMLIGHIVLGYQKVNSILTELNIDEKLKMKLLHICLSHHGHLEYGSPKLPAFPEAMLVYHADNLDAKVHQIQALKADANKEDVSMYHKNFGNIYLK